jgi:hypothetical protein
LCPYMVGLVVTGVWVLAFGLILIRGGTPVWSKDAVVRIVRGIDVGA